jgi:hypothetical protein
MQYPAPAPVRLVLAQQHAPLARALTRLLRPHYDVVEVVTSLRDVAAALTGGPGDPPADLLVGVRFAEGGDLDQTWVDSVRNLARRVVVYSSEAPRLLRGVDAFVAKDDLPDALLAALAPTAARASAAA